MAAQNVEAIYALSPQQKGMFFESLAAPENAGLYIEQEVHPLYQGLNLSAFHQAWRYLFARHPILRTAFIWKDQEEPFQVVLLTSEPFMQFEDWRWLPPPEQQKRLEGFVESETARPFDLARPPLMRLAVIQTGENSFYFVWLQHHILMDGWCRPLIFRELVAAYMALCQGQQPMLPPVRPYKDYIAWLSRRDLAAAERFWRERLRGFSEPTPLGVLDPTPMAEAGAVFGREGGTLDADLITAVESVTRQNRVSLNAVAQGVWAVLLSRYSGREDVVFGATVSGRSGQFPGIESMIGLFINTLPVRVAVASGLPFGEWLTRLQANFLAATEYEFCSAGQIHEWSEIPASHPLYESLLVFENYPEAAGPANAGGMKAEGGQSAGARTRYPLTLLLTAGKGLHVRAVYDRRRLSSAAVRTMLKHFQGLFQAIAAEPHLSPAALAERIPRSEIPTVRPRERGSREFVAPRTPVEETLVRIWTEVLGLERIGVEDSFLELGGHSLLATQLISRVSKAFEIGLPIHVLFEAGSIARLAEAVEDLVLCDLEKMPEEEARRLVASEDRPR